LAWCVRPSQNLCLIHKNEWDGWTTERDVFVGCFMSRISCLGNISQNCVVHVGSVLPAESISKKSVHVLRMVCIQRVRLDHGCTTYILLDPPETAWNLGTMNKFNKFRCPFIGGIPLILPSAQNGKLNDFIRNLPCETHASFWSYKKLDCKRTYLQFSFFFGLGMDALAP
jgi:hypothetical protein